MTRKPNSVLDQSSLHSRGRSHGALMKLNPGKEAKLNYFSLYFAFSVPQVIRIWKEEDLLLDKTFRATVSFGGLHLSSQVSLELNPGP